MSQSPSLRGSGRFWKSMPPPSGGGATSQSPSLRGSGRFPFSSDRKNSHSWCLNPLHCGAVVASFGPPHGGGAGRGLNPLHCGAVVASPGAVDRRADEQPVSIPFIAGQWSLPPSCSPLSLPTPSRLNPLHCGAVVASSSATPSGAGSPTSLNPLHCGAVVASGNRRKIWRNPVKVSIPFIAGSGRFWRVSPPGAAAGSRSQSPSLRGSGRFPAAPRVL